MDNIQNDVLSDALDIFNNLTKKPEIYLSIQENKSLQIRNLLKNVYDYTKFGEVANSNNRALQTLIIKDFDEEQIWQQLELQNDGTWPRFITNVSKFYSTRSSLYFNTSDQEGNNVNTDPDMCGVVENEEMVESIQKEDLNDEVDSDCSSFNYSSDSDAEGELSKKIIVRVKGKHKPSVVDDKFFKLNELENYLNEQDRNVMNEKQPDHEDEASDADSIDLFDDIDSAYDMEEDNEDDEDDREKYPRYADFFDPPEGETAENEMVRNNFQNDDDYSRESDIESGEDQDTTDIPKKVRFRLSRSESDNSVISSVDEGFNNEKTENGDNSEAVKSSFEIRQERLKKKIGHLEKAALDDKPWQLKGEIDATNRPQNSLLEEIVEFDLTSRPAPVITQETTLKLEDIIKRRIKDKAWDDVERKIKPIDTPLEYKKKLVMNQEKSKESLSQIYEQEYLKQKAALDPESLEKPEEEPKDHLEIREMLTSLFAKLDALSNFHYTPRPVAPEIKIVNNLPAISMEEVAPVSTSDATLLAPQEIQNKTKGDIIGRNERTVTDKKRERRQKKLKQHNREKERQQKEKLSNNLKPISGDKYSKENAAKLLHKLSKDRNIKKMDVIGNDKSTKSSRAFFTQLQEEVQGQIKSKVKRITNKSKHKVTAKDVKL